jgi:O-antigen/teichoic acid export membrane protein
MIVAHMGEEALGLYSVGYNMASYMSDMMMFAVSYSVVPIYVGIYKNDGREHTEQFLQKCLKYLMTVMIPIFFGYVIISKDLFLVLASEKYVSAASFSPIILLGSYLIGMNSIFNAGLYLQKKTKTIMGIMLAALFMNIVLNILLIPRYGIYGAALATLGACMLSSVLTIAFSSKYITVRVDCGRWFLCALSVMFGTLSIKQIIVVDPLLKIAQAQYNTRYIFKEKELTYIIRTKRLI